MGLVPLDPTRSPKKTRPRSSLDAGPGPDPGYKCLLKAGN